MDDIFKQIASYSYCPESEMSITTAKNGVECSLFAITFATTLAFGNIQIKSVMTKISYGNMKISYGQKNSMEEFPITQKKQLVIKFFVLLWNCIALAGCLASTMKQKNE